MTRTSKWPFIVAFAGDEPQSPTTEHEAQESEQSKPEPMPVVGMRLLEKFTDSEGATP